MSATLAVPDVAAADLQSVGFGRMLRVHLRIWRCSRPVLITAAVAVLLGVGTFAFTVGTHRGVLDAAAVVSELGAAKTVFAFFWPIIGAVAGASAFTSRWSLIVLAVAPRRGRWLLADLVSFLLVPAIGGLIFLAADFAAAAVCGAGVGRAAAVLSQAGSVLIPTVVNAAAGFLLGFSLRSVTVAIVAMFLVPLVLQLAVRSFDVSTWLTLDTATAALSSGTLGAHHGLPVLTAVLVWLAAPAYLAWTRLRSSAG